MSYTAPTNVQTKEQAILALASTIAGEDKTALGNGSVNKALDVLADVLAQQDVDVPQTNAGAILALAQYAQGGGGIQLETVLDEDVTFTYWQNVSNNPQARYATTDSSTVSLFSFERGDVYVCELGGVASLSIGIASEEVQYTIGSGEYLMSWDIDYNLQDQVEFNIYVGDYDSTTTDATLQAWCQTQHHVTIKKCNVLA